MSSQRGIEYHLQSASYRVRTVLSVVVDKTLDVFQDEPPRLLVFQDSGDLEEERPSCVLEAEPFSCRRERLTGESCEQKVKIGYFRGMYLRNIAVYILVRVVLPQNVHRIRLDF